MGQVHQVHPALAFRRFVLTGSPEKKVYQLATILLTKPALRLVQSSFAKRYLMKARLGFAMAVAVVKER